MSPNQSVIKTIDSIIEHADQAGLYIQHIDVGREVMRSLAEELSDVIDKETRHVFEISKISRYREIKILEIDTPGIRVKYLLNNEEFSNI
jgi:hypothetical protein